VAKGWGLRALLVEKSRRDAVDTVANSPLVAGAKVLMNWVMPVESADKNVPEDIDKKLTMK
jgi:hypothetical protein